MEMKEKDDEYYLGIPIKQVEIKPDGIPKDKGTQNK